MSTVKPSTSKPYRIKVPKGLDLDTSQFVDLYRFMSQTRRLENRLSVLYRQNLIVGGLYSSLGQEATSVGTAYALGDGDFLSPMIRNLGSYLVRGISAKDFVGQYLARECSPTRGKDGTMHFGSFELGLIGCISVLGTLIPVMVGMALVMKQRKQKNVTLTYIGDGGTSTTDFHEGLNFAAVQRVPFILVCESNLYAYSTPTAKQMPVKDIVQKAKSYGIYGEKFDGNNVLAAYDVTRRAREMCIAGEGPVLIESKSFRRKGHAEHDPADYVPKKVRAYWEARDPLDAYARFILDEQIAAQPDLDAIDNAIEEELDNAVDEVKASPFPPKSLALEDVYAPDNDGGAR